jgi:hypothetical protein
MASSIGGILSFVLVWSSCCWMRHSLTCIEDRRTSAALSHYILQDSILHSHHCVNLKFNKPHLAHKYPAKFLRS